MKIAIAEAEAASKRGDIPVGAVIVAADEKKNIGTIRKYG